jgi:hypothetical protein
LQSAAIIWIRQTGNSRYAVVRNFLTAITLRQVVLATIEKTFICELYSPQFFILENVLDGIAVRLKRMNASAEGHKYNSAEKFR